MRLVTELRFAYTVAQVAEGFGRSELTIRRWIKAGRLKAVRIGGTWYVPADELDALLHPVSDEGDG
jgi:excisionase family DNA binding protein